MGVFYCSVSLGVVSRVPVHGTSFFFFFLCLPLFVLEFVGPWWSLFVPSFLFSGRNSFAFPLTCLIMRTSSGPNRPSGLSIGGSSIEKS